MESDITLPKGLEYWEKKAGPARQAHQVKWLPRRCVDKISQPTRVPLHAISHPPLRTLA